MITAVDIGGTKIAVEMVDRSGCVHATANCPTRAELGFEDGVRRITGLFSEAQQSIGEAIDGIGIGCTGPVDPRSGTIGKAELLRGWWDSPLTERLAKEFHVSVAMENDGDAVALSESKWGAGSDAQCLVCIVIGTGIGGGIVRTGALYRVANGGDPEPGHMALDVSTGQKCYCGLTGCWESLASGPALEASYSAGTTGAAEICQRAGAEEPRARQAVERVRRYLGIGLANVVTMCGPDVVLLGGGVMGDADLFLDDIRLMVHALATQVPTDGLRIEVVNFSEAAAIRGDAAAWLHRFAQEEKAL
jgi:glucokinase